MQNILEIRDQGRSYVNFRLEHISLSIPGGTIMGLVGENGAGKSTTIRAALGLIRKDAGEVLYCGEPLTTDSAAMKEQIGVVFDSICFYPELTVEKAGKICRKTYRNWDEAYFRELLEQFSLDPKQKIKALSRGMSMKLSLVLAFAHRPKLLILDEPMNGLDKDGVQDMRRYLLHLKEQGKTILLASHSAEDISVLCDTVCEMDKGKLTIIS